MILRFLLPGIAFVLTLVLGLWLSRLGRPYNGVLFNLHKLVALGAVIAASIQAVGLLRGGEPLPLLIGAMAAAALAVVALFASGAMMSAGRLDPVRLLTIHRVAIALAAVAIVLALL